MPETTDSPASSANVRKAKSAAKPSPAKPASKSTPKPQTKAPARAGAKATSKSAAKTSAKTSTKPSSKTAPKTAKKPPSKPAAKSGTAPAAKPATKPQAKASPKREPKPAPKSRSASRAKQPAAQPQTEWPTSTPIQDFGPSTPVLPSPPVSMPAPSTPTPSTSTPAVPAPAHSITSAPRVTPAPQPTQTPRPASATHTPAHNRQSPAPARQTPPPARREEVSNLADAPAPARTATAATSPADDDRDNQPPEHHEPLNPETFATDITFDDLGLHPAIARGVKDLGFRHPTHIQAKLIPVFLTGKDILGQAKTGTGKTASFALPLLHMVERGVWGQALILAPTRELAIQIHAEFVKLGKHMPVRAVPIYGGQPIKTQAQKLEKGCEIIVGTPGRLMDMIERRLIDPRAVRFAVLDEVDRMLDIGFREDIRRILKMTPGDRQTVMVSATIRGDIEDLARRYMRDPEKLVTTAGALTVDLVAQHYLSVEPWDKRRLLHHLLTHEEPALTLIFCRLKKTVDDLAYYLNKHGIEAHAMHGDMSQSKRNSTMRQLRAGDLAVLIASDLASRGIDVEGITHVINYDLPEDPDLYVHRIGRTARAGRDGVAWAFVTPRQGKLLSQIEDLINAQIPKMDYPDFQPSPRPEGYRDEPTGGRPVYEVQNVGDKPRNRYAEVERPTLPKPAALAIDPAKFPGGIVPTKMPPNRMRGKIKSGR